MLHVLFVFSSVCCDNTSLTALTAAWQPVYTWAGCWSNTYIKIGSIIVSLQALYCGWRPPAEWSAASTWCYSVQCVTRGNTRLSTANGMHAIWIVGHSCLAGHLAWEGIKWPRVPPVVLFNMPCCSMGLWACMLPLELLLANSTQVLEAEPCWVTQYSCTAPNARNAIG